MAEQVTGSRLFGISILHQNEDLIIVNKGTDIKINSDNPLDDVTVSTQLQHLLPGSFDNTLAHGYRFVHRLDYATSGALCVALTKKGAKRAGKSFQAGSVTKHYLALVRGHVDTNQENVLDINIGIGKDISRTDVNKMCVESNSECDSPRHAQTKLILLEHGLYDQDPASLVLLIPSTGRTHQLRVHCLHIGHLIIGDYTYSDRKEVNPNRMMLHAYRLVIPMGDELIDVTAPNPFTQDPLWNPTQTFTTYEQLLQEKLEIQSSKLSNKR